MGVFLGLLHQGVKRTVGESLRDDGVDNVNQLLITLLCNHAFVDLSVLQHDVRNGQVIVRCQIVFGDDIVHHDGFNLVLLEFSDKVGEFDKLQAGDVLGHVGGQLSLHGPFLRADRLSAVV